MTHSTSDHPIRNSPKKIYPAWLKTSYLPWAGLLGVVIVAGGVWGASQLLSSSTSKDAPQPLGLAVDTLTVRFQTVPSSLELSGTVQAIDKAVLSTRVTGRITKLSLEAGDRFQKGEVLARIDVVDFTAQTNQARSGVDQAQAELARSRSTLSQLQAQKLENQASLRLANINQARNAQLRSEGVISQSLLDEANTRLEEAKARLAQTEAGIQQAEAAIAQSTAAINRAESGVTSALASESYGAVIAPFDGVVMQKLAYEGELASPGTLLLKVENPDRLQLEVSVPEENLRYLQKGQTVVVRVDAANQSFKSTVQQIIPSSDPAARSFLIKVPIPSQRQGIIAGMFGRIELPHGMQQKILIPQTALLRRGQLEGVYVVNPKVEQNSPQALLRWVKTGKVENEQVEIVSGLTEGDRIITNNITQLHDGQIVTIKN